MWVYYNPNPDNQKRVGDCTVRAVAKALDVSWDDAYILMAVKGYQLKDMPSANISWGTVLQNHGFKRFNLPSDCPNCLTIREFCSKYTNGIFVLGTGNHVVAVINGDYYDTWDSGDEVVAYVWCLPY